MACRSVLHRLDNTNLVWSDALETPLCWCLWKSSQIFCRPSSSPRSPRFPAFAAAVRWHGSRVAGEFGDGPSPCCRCSAMANLTGQCIWGIGLIRTSATSFCLVPRAVVCSAELDRLIRKRRWTQRSPEGAPHDHHPDDQCPGWRRRRCSPSPGGFTCQV